MATTYPGRRDVWDPASTDGPTRSCLPERFRQRLSRARPIPGPGLLIDPPVRMPDHPAPRSAGMPRGERIGPDLVHVVSAWRLAPDDLPGIFVGAGVVDALAAGSRPAIGGNARSGGRPGIGERDGPRSS